jgi:tetratricopeptide (TPR) repeat protein
MAPTPATERKKNLAPLPPSLEWAPFASAPATGLRRGGAQGPGPGSGPRLPASPASENPRKPMAIVRRTGRAAALAIALLACPGLAAAREDDPTYALALARRGYDDLAQKEIDRMPAGENREYTRCLLTQEAARLAAGNPKTEAKVVRTKFDAARRAMEAFLKQFSGSSLRAEVELDFANLNKDFAYFLTKPEVLEAFTPKEQAEMKSEADRVFEDAIKYLGQIKEREQARGSAVPDTDPEFDERFHKRNIAWYYMCLAMKDRAVALPPGDALRVQHLSRGIDEATLFLEETDGYLFGYYSGWLLGEMHRYRGQLASGWSADDIRAAKDWFDNPMGGADIENVEQEWPPLVAVVFQSAVDFGKMCNQVGVLDGTNYPKLLVDRAANIEAKLPSHRSNPHGLLLLVEKARAMATLGAHGGAVALLNRVSNWADQAGHRGVDQEAKRALNDVLAGIPAESTERIGADVLLKAGEGSLRDGNFARSIRAFQRLLLIIDAEADPARKAALKKEYYGRAWSRINECYMRLQRFLEAFHAADVPVQDYIASGRADEDEDIGDLAKYRISALTQWLAKAPEEAQPEIQDAIKRAKELVASRFAWSGGTDSIYAVGLDKMNQAKAARRAGDATRATELLNGAIAEFRKLDAKDGYFAIAQARIAESLFLLGRNEEVLKHVDAFVAKHQKEWEDPATPARQRQPWGYAVFWAASAHDGMKAHAKIVAALDGFESRFKGAGLEAFFPRARELRIRGLLAAGKGADAERECDVLLKESPGDENTIKAALSVANDLKVRADRTRKEGDRKSEEALRRRAVRLYDAWIDASEGATADNYKFVGVLHEELGNAERASVLWQKSYEMYRASGDEKMAETLTIYLAGLLVGQGRYAEALPRFETLFVRTPEDIQGLRSVLTLVVKSRPGNVAAPVWDKKVKESLERIAALLAKDPAGAPAAAEAKKAAGSMDPEILVRACADTPELRLALARAASTVLLGADAAWPAEHRNAILGLVKRTPDLMSNLARCYDELATAAPENPIRAVNLYAVLIEAAPDAEDPENPAPGQKYSDRWFEWKYRWIRTHLTTGIAHKNPEWLHVVCGLVRSMDILGEIKRAGLVNVDAGKRFEELRAQADAALRALKMEGCK